MSKTSGGGRLAFIDWTRGLAAVIMLQGHVFHSFAHPEIQADSPYILSQFVGGMPPAFFLFLAGVTFAFLMSSRERDAVSPGKRILAALYRARYLFLLAFAFRLQMWVFGQPNAPWTDLLKVDILNSMGFAMALFGWMALLSTAARARAAAVAGVLIAAAAPIVTSFDWTGIPAVVKNYLAPDYNYFGFFPWGSFLAFGLSAGSIIRLVKPEKLDRLMQWTCLGGITLVFTCQYFSNLPYSLYPNSEFWLDSPMLTLIKLGVILLFLSFAYLWTTYHLGDKWSWVRQIGTTSLIVYWVHIELVYGSLFWFWQKQLGNLACVFGSVILIAAMLGLSILQTRAKSWRRPSLRMSFPFFSTPNRAEGD